MFVINKSNSSSLQPLYEADIDTLFSAIRLNSVALDTPRSLAMQCDDSPSSIRFVRVSTDNVNRGRPRPEPLCNSRVTNVCSFSLSCWMRVLRSASADRMFSPTSTMSPRALNRTQSWRHANSNPSMSTGVLSRMCVSRSCSRWKMSRFSDS